MRKLSLDTTFRLRLAHQPGQFARLSAAIAAQGGLLGDITTTRITETDVVRDVTVEMTDHDHMSKVLSAIRAVAGVEVLGITDPVIQCHRGGKIRMKSTVAIRNADDLRRVYTPGVARIARSIQENPALAFELTSMGGTVGIFTNGTRVLGLGDVGPLASLPVMEGKAVLYDTLAGVSAVPLLVDTKDPREFVETVVRLSRGFGAIHLEDIRSPDCFFIEEQLRERLRKPVLHDDQHGTATAVLAAIINACREVRLDMRRAQVGQIGLGAAGTAIARLLLAYGVSDVRVYDPDPTRVEELVRHGAKPAAGVAELLAACDVAVATTGKAGLIRPEHVRKGQVLLALSNPDAEIEPAVAREAGAAFAGDGRSINNALAFPGLFKGALKARSRAITQEMLIAAAEVIAFRAEHGDLVPSPLNLEVHEAVCAVTMSTARDQGLDNTAEP